MIDLPSSQVIEKIIAQTDLTKEQVQKRIKEKLTQLSGLISEDGAAHIVANDLKVQLYKTQGSMKISELSQSAKTTTVTGKIMQKYDVREFDKNGRQGKVANILMGDETGTIRVVFWNDQVDLFEKLKEQDIIQVSNPYIKENMGKLEAHLNERSEVKINPEGVTINVPERTFSEAKTEVKYLKDLQGNEQNVEVLGTIVQVYDPRFFTVCPQCNKRLKEDTSCATHGAIEPMTNYVTTCFLDDGTANIRTTFWKKETQDLFQKTDAEILSWNTDASKLVEPKNALLGEIVKIVGKTQKNAQYGQVELTATKVFTDVDPSAELARLNGGENTSAKPSEPSPKQAETKVEPQTEKKPVDSRVYSEEEYTKAEEPTMQNTPDEEIVKEKPVVTQENRKVKPEDLEFSDGTQIKEEVINIDDLEDL